MPIEQVPPDRDAAKVDGANAFYRFFKITVPMISPVHLRDVSHPVVDRSTAAEPFPPPAALWARAVAY